MNLKMQQRKVRRPPDCAANQGSLKDQVPLTDKHTSEAPAKRIPSSFKLPVSSPPVFITFPQASPPDGRGSCSELRPIVTDNEMLLMWPSPPRVCPGTFIKEGSDAARWDVVGADASSSSSRSVFITDSLIPDPFFPATSPLNVLPSRHAEGSTETSLPPLTFMACCLEDEMQLL